jgi:quercetin dioxygenase-like cupin family protein
MRVRWKGDDMMRAVLWGISLVFSLTMSGYVQGSDTAKVEVLTKTTSSWDGSALLPYPKGQPQITILRITVPPKTQLPVHEHPVINAGVLLKGQLTVVTEDKKVLHLKAGDPIVELVNTLHFGKNEGDEPAEIIVFYAGIKDEPITIEK